MAGDETVPWARVVAVACFGINMGYGIGDAAVAYGVILPPVVHWQGWRGSANERGDARQRHARVKWQGWPAVLAVSAAWGCSKQGLWWGRRGDRVRR